MVAHSTKYSVTNIESYFQKSPSQKVFCCKNGISKSYLAIYGISIQSTITENIILSYKLIQDHVRSWFCCCLVYFKSCLVAMDASKFRNYFLDGANVLSMSFIRGVLFFWHFRATMCSEAYMYSSDILHPAVFHISHYLTGFLLAFFTTNILWSPQMTSFSNISMC